MPKLELAISSHQTARRPARRIALPARSFVSSPSPLSPAPPSLSLALYVAYLRYRSQIQSRDSGADISRARGAPQSFVPKCEVGSQARVDCRIPRGRSLLFHLFFLLSFFLSSFFFANLRETEAGWRLGYPPLPRGRGWRGCINIMQISGAAALLHRGRARARAREVVTFLPLRGTLPPVDAKCRCLFPPRYARLACLPYRPEIACTLHTRHNSTPNLLQPPSHSSSRSLPAGAAPLPAFLSAVLSYRSLSPFSTALSFRGATMLLTQLALSSPAPLRPLLAYDDPTSSFLRSSIWGWTRPELRDLETSRWRIALPAKASFTPCDVCCWISHVRARRDDELGVFVADSFVATVIDKDLCVYDSILRLGLLSIFAV